MNALKFAQVLTQKRKDKGLTQDDLANYVGVSKASVSKWETGQCYPDILTLPVLATYFNISIDELLGYSPTLDHAGIEHLYNSFLHKFEKEPFDVVITQVEEAIKKYYACMPLVLKMAYLLTNHFMIAPTPGKQADILNRIVSLCDHIKSEAEDLNLVTAANSLQANIYLIQNAPLDVIENLKGVITPTSSDEPILASAYQLIGKRDKAIQVLQAGQFNHLMQLMSIMPTYAMLSVEYPIKFDLIAKRTLALMSTFELDTLNTGIAVQIYLALAQGYMQIGNKEVALNHLEKYTDLCTKCLFPIKLDGDDYFDHLKDWFKEIELRTQAPRSEKIIQQSMLQGLALNPYFEALKEEPRFIRMHQQLKQFVEHNIGGIS